LGKALATIGVIGGLVFLLFRLCLVLKELTTNCTNDTKGRTLITQIRLIYTEDYLERMCDL